MSVFSTLAREFAFARDVLPALFAVSRNKLTSRRTLVDLIEGWARSRPDGIAILFEDRVVTWREYDGAANRWARWARDQGITRGDVVGLMVANRPEFLFAWAGLAKIGAVGALINTNLSGPPLAHSINVAAARVLVADAEFTAQVASALPLLETEPRLWITGGTTEDAAHAGGADLDRALTHLADTPIEPAARAGIVGRDTLFYIYTSGTTGNPKAARISHMRAMQAASGFAALIRARPDDRMYVVLPLYHSAGGMVAVGTMLVAGGTIVLRRKFSASEFWSDCARYGATLFQYIGELCRYLNNAPPHPAERSHRLRTVIGNGLRPELWESFRTRFAIPRILEFYAATEGNVTLFNVDGRVGSIGRIPSWLQAVMKVRLVRFDVASESPVRGPDGLCIRCADNEPGEAIGEIPSNPNSSLGRFEGYKGADETKRKILTDVFTTGDAWFRTGDLLRRDAEGYFYFVDRIGDTFRWKGENVATSEVAEALSSFPGVLEANVYGVSVPGADGRAGMAAIVAAPDLDLAALERHLAAPLPAYAVPLFLRLMPEIEVTGTFKHRKVDLVEQGYDPATVPDPLFMRDAGAGGYRTLDRDLHARIVAGAIRI